MPFSGNVGRDEEEEPLTELFDRSGHWLPDSRPQAWGDPEAAENDRQFWAVFHLCLERLPPKQAQVFMMREMLELTTPEICRNLELTENHVNVLLYRARMRVSKNAGSKGITDDDELSGSHPFALRSARTAAERYREVGVAFPSVDVFGLPPVRDTRRQFGPVGESVREGQRRTACV
ncbi:RNA polymerase subunit sigma, ECF subfamily [Hydrogenophilus thermoluteolus]|uniref:RNA polymerase subunit sigma, ECF subfamily n=1 Tax=Hydrogenophilus thermoluteolus TaxID=297 RepID=A0A2Z6DZK2_HYDTE|nr:RNA polymerase subunit sigma, ECF subfamily [Hydrogenophilus thermoluteolus]